MPPHHTQDKGDLDALAFRSLAHAVAGPSPAAVVGSGPTFEA